MMNNKNNKVEYYLQRLRDKTQQIDVRFKDPAPVFAAQPDFVHDDEISFNPITKRISVHKDITFQDLYSYGKDLWKNSNLINESFPFTSIHPGQFIVENGWDFKHDGTRAYIKDAGWEVFDEDGNKVNQYTCIKTLGPEHKEQLHYSLDGSPVQTFSRLGQVNEAVCTWRFDKPAKSIAVLSKETGHCSTECGIEELQPNVVHIPMFVQIDAYR